MDEFEQGVWGATGKLKRYAMKLYRNPHRAEDAVQDTICRALANRERFDGSNLIQWLYTILKNAFRTQNRRAHRLVFTDDNSYADKLRAAGDPESILIARESISMLDRVPPKQREVIIALGLGYNGKEVAKMADIPNGTVRSRANRGRLELERLAA